MSDVIEAPATIFTGNRGSWFKAVLPLDRPFKGVKADDLYQMIELKQFPCFNVAQAPVECGVAIHDRLNGDLSHVKRIVLKKSAVEARIPFRPDRPKYPSSHPEADHHMEYCICSGLLYGSLMPVHFEKEYIESSNIRQLIDITELKVFTEEELADMGGNTGGCSLDVYLDDGTVLHEERKHSTGNVIGENAQTRNLVMQKITDAKQKMIESNYGYDLSAVKRIIDDLENHEASEIVTALREAIGNDR